MIFFFLVGYCNQPPYPPQFGVVDPIKASYSHGEVVHYFCSNDHNSPHHKTTCTVDGTWKPNPARLNCTMPGKECTREQRNVPIQSETIQYLKTYF